MQFSSLGRCVGAMALLAMISFSSSYAQAQNSALERAMRAALRGPEAKRIKIRGHQFNVKPIRRTRTRNGVIVKGQISHHLNLRKDDQVYYTIHKRGNVIENIDIRIRRGGITGTLGLGFVQSGLSRIFRGLPLPPNPLQAVGRRLESLLDGSWESVAKYLVGHVAIRVKAPVVVKPRPPKLPPKPPRPTVPRPRPPAPVNYFFGVRASLINVEDYTADESADEQPENDQRRRRRVRVRPGAGQPEYVRGFRVNSVVPRSPAARAGLEPGDVMVEANGRLLNSWRAFDGAISASRGKLSLVVLNVRNGQLTPVRVQLEKQQQRVRR